MWIVRFASRDGRRRASLRLTQERYRAGAVNYLDVVTTQTIALTNERMQAQIHARRLELSTALCDGWDRAALDSSVERVAQTMTLFRTRDAMTPLTHSDAATDPATAISTGIKNA